MAKKCMFIFVIIFIGILVSCGPNKIEQLKKEVKNIAQKMNEEYLSVRDNVTELLNEIENVYSSTDLNTIDISGMEEANGGRYYYFQDKMFVTRYNQPKDSWVNCFFGAIPLTDEIKKKMQLADLKIGPKMKELVNSSPYIGRTAFITAYNTDITHPDVDAPSVLPVGFDFNVFPWFGATLAMEQGVIYFAEPTITIASEGAIQSVMSSVYVNGKAEGITSTDFTLLPFTNSYVKDNENLILIIYENLSLFAASPTAKKNLKLIVLEEFSIVEQLQDNPEISEEIKLNNEKQQSGIQTLANLVTKENVDKEGLSIEIEGTKYTVWIEEVPTGRMFIVGLI